MRLLFLLLAALSAFAQAVEPREQTVRYLNAIGQRQVQERARAVAAVQTQADAERRKSLVRKKILELIGGLPEARGPLNTRQFGTLDGDGFRVEKIAYQSQPGFFVTADVYVPATGSGPFPAVVLSAGHGPGKQEHYALGGNLARNGIIALAWDPLGQGERLQNLDPATGASTVGQGTGEHGYANVETMLIGEHISRYFIWDAMRGVDYLTGRKDVDASRIGAYGCSGGGTATAYLAALDDRVKVAATACYITSFQELLPTAGPQEAEQSIPHFLEQGLGFGDWVELAAPKPYAIVSTTNDMFPLEGARQTFEEAKRFYGLYGAGDRLQWITGPGGHGALGPLYPEILAFFVRWLNSSELKPEYAQLKPARIEDLRCTATGQVATSLGGETVYSINRQRAAALPKPKSDVREDIRALAAVAARPGSPPPAVSVTGSTQRDGYRLDFISLASEPGIDLSGLIAVPTREGPRPALLLLAAAGGDVDRLAKAGWIVFVFQPRVIPEGKEGVQSPLLGMFNLLSLRAFVVGKTIVGMRVDDTIRAIDWLCSRPDVDRSAISASGAGPLGVVLLHAAVLDTRISRVFLQGALTSYRMAVDQPLHRNLPEVMIPGVLRKYDIGDLLLATSPRRVVIINPTDAAGAAVGEPEFRRELGSVLNSERIHPMWREAALPLPIE